MRARVLVLMAFGSVGCRAVVDSGATYRACDRAHYSEHFSPGTTEKNLIERCWFFDNVLDVDDVFVEDEDLIIRVGMGATWGLSTQGPYAYRRMKKDFVIGTRVEILDQVNGAHCLDPGDAVGIVVRKEGHWASLFISLFTPDPPPPGLDCNGLDEAVPPVKASVHRTNDAWGLPVEFTGVDQAGIGFDGEADVAMCRLNGLLTAYYRDLSSDPTEEPLWIPIGDGLLVGDGEIDVGLTAQGSSAEGHFQWVEFSGRVGGDGCVGELALMQVPSFE
jgi:hypothetical protein